MLVLGHLAIRGSASTVAAAIPRAALARLSCISDRGVPWSMARSFRDRVVPLDMNMQKEVKELMHICERLIGFAHQNDRLSDEKCEAVVSYA